MAKISTADVAELEFLRSEFHHWRSTRLKRSSVPADLWQRAIVEAKVHGVTNVAKLLGLNRARFKNGCDSSVAKTLLQQSTPTFIALTPPAPVLQNESSPQACTIELHNHRAQQTLKITLRHGTGELVGLVQALWGRA